MCDKLKCDFFHETDGECCASRRTCFLLDRPPIVARATIAPVHEPLDMKGFLVILGFAAVCYVVGLGILAHYQPRSATYLAPLSRIMP